MQVAPDLKGWRLTTKPCLEQCLENVERITGQRISAQSTLTLGMWHPETCDDTPLDAKGVANCRSLIGMAHWLVALQRVDIHHAVSALASFSHIAMEKHLGDAMRTFECLNKCPDRHLETRNQRTGN